MVRLPAALASGSGQTVPIQRSFMGRGIPLAAFQRKFAVTSLERPWNILLFVHNFGRADSIARHATVSSLLLG